MWENRETAGCMQTWISKRLMARLIEYRRVINGTRWDSLPRNQVWIKKHPWISNLFPLSKLHPTITLVETYLPLKILPLNLNLKRGERRDARLSLSLFSLRDSIFLLFYKFPLFIFSFRRMKMKRQYLSMNKRGERERGRRKKRRKIHARLSVFDTIATRSAGGMSFSANLPPSLPSTLGAAGNRSARSVIDSELLHTTFVRASRCNRVMTENCVITQLFRGGERSI